MNEPEKIIVSEHPDGMSLVVKTVTRWVKSFIFIFGLYIVLYGHLTPGGGFAGGVIVSCSFILVLLAFGKKRAFRKLSLEKAGMLDSVGALGFLVVAVAGALFAGTFFVNWLSVPTSESLNSLLRKMGVGDFRLLSAGTIPVNNIWIAIKVCASIFLAFALLAMLRINETQEE